MSCPHIKDLSFANINSTTEFYKEECYFCFDDQDSPLGVDLCLSCLFTGCRPTVEDLNEGKVNHGALHFEKFSQHHIVLNIKRVAKDTPNPRGEDGAPSPKLTKLIIQDEDDAKKYDMLYKPRCIPCALDLDMDSYPQLAKAVGLIESATSTSQRIQTQAWEETRTSCEHVLCLDQLPNLQPITSDVRCNSCDLTQNMWVCLTCGALGCGRRQYDGSGGNGHGLEHFQKTGHAVSCKLGTITPEGEADIYCYICDDERIDPELKMHLHGLGIEIHQMAKTEKSVTELQIEHNLQFDFSMTTEDGRELEKVARVGLRNLGNSCYMASVLQVILSLPDIKERYYREGSLHHMTCQENPLACFSCQMVKLAYGLHSGRYVGWEEGIAPTMFKRLVGKGHSEFSTMQQQDAYEFLGHLQTVLEKAEKNEPAPHTADGFKFQMEHRLECQSCNRVRYTIDTSHSLILPVPKPDSEDGSVTLESCLAAFFAPESVEGYMCSQCQTKTVAIRTVRFLTFPEILIVNLRRFELVRWVPTKVETPVLLSQSDLAPSLLQYRAPPHPEGEQLLPEDAEDSVVPELNRNILTQMLELGLKENQCIRALRATGGNDAEAAIAWVFEHIDDPDIDEPLPSSTIKSSTNVDQDKVCSLVAMGFSVPHATSALIATNSNMEQAVEWIFSHPEDTQELSHMASPAAEQTRSVGLSTLENMDPYRLIGFISHKGTSTSCGHYVSHVLLPPPSTSNHDYSASQSEQSNTLRQHWVLFNDNKVALQPNPPTTSAYVYFFSSLK